MQLRETCVIIEIEDLKKLKSNLIIDFNELTLPESQALVIGQCTKFLNCKPVESRGWIKRLPHRRQI